MYPLTGNLLTVLTNARHSQRPTGAYYFSHVVEWYMQAIYINNIAFSSSGTASEIAPYIDIFQYYGVNNITDFSNFLYGGHALKKINIDTSKGINFNGFLNSCYIFNDSLTIDVHNGTNFTGFMTACYNYQQTLTLDIGNGLIFTDFLYKLFAAKKIHLINMPLTFNTLLLYGSFDVDALVILFNDLVDRTGESAGTLTVSHAFGYPQLTTSQRQIATNKNWTLA